MSGAGKETLFWPPPDDPELHGRRHAYFPQGLGPYTDGSEENHAWLQGRLDAGEVLPPDLMHWLSVQTLLRKHRDEGGLCWADMKALKIHWAEYDRSARGYEPTEEDHREIEGLSLKAALGIDEDAEVPLEELRKRYEQQGGSD